jgi:uncharacterized protein (DUF2141 family)/pimeloyl-ACP methyl ester carboxylesterase
MTIHTVKFKISSTFISLIFLSMVILCSSVVYAQDTNKSTIKITVNGLKTDEGVVRIAIYDSEEGWYKKSIYSGTVKINNNKCEWTVENVPYGDYAVSVYHDKNSNDKMDINNSNIPSEPFGYSRVKQMLMGPARWNDTRFSITSPNMEIEVMVLEIPPAFLDSMKQNITFKDKIDIGGYKLNICCFGKGKPAVIVEAGAGEPAVESGSWKAVISAIAPTTQVCLYDRAGLGLSDRAPDQDRSNRTSRDMVKDLHTLLEKAGIPAPYILVGHSIGGYNVRLYASQYPKDVAGMVLVDSSHPDQWSKFSAALPPARPDESGSLRTARSSIEPLDPNDPEKMDVATSGAQVRATGLLGDLPLVVITSAPGTIFVPNLPTDLSDKLSRVWQDMQIDLEGLSSNSTHIIASHAGHYIQVDEPQLVIDAILKLIGKAKK